MPPKVARVKPNKDALKKKVELPECEVKEVEVWYPPDEFLVYAHDIMIERYGYWSGFELGLEPYHHIVEEMKNADDIYRKAAILLRGVVTTRIFQDGHHRTGFEVTKAFLEMNGAQMKEIDERKIIKFIKDIRRYSLDEIESWLRNGSL
jgi:death-on-curing family protein